MRKGSPCTIEGCEGPIIARGWCGKHYRRWQRNGTTEDPEPTPVLPCSVTTCTRTAHALGLCNLHYQRQRRGQPLTHEPAPPIDGKRCSIPDCIRPHVARSLCGMHYRRLRLHGDPLGGGPFMDAPPPRVCDLKGCSRPHFAKGYCHGHYMRLQDHGDPLGGRSSSVLGIEVERTCTADDCDQEAQCEDLCWAHYNRKRYADPEYRENWKRWTQDRRARKQAAFVESFAPAAIFRRDGWRCGICGQHIDKRLKHPHPRSASIDHVIPLSKDGEHSRANVQAAHLDCNLRKSNRAAGEQLRIIG